MIRTEPACSCKMSPSTSVSFASTSNNVWDASSLRVSVSSTATGLSLTLAISTAISVVWELTDEPSAPFSPASLTFAVSCRRLAPFAFATGTRETFCKSVISNGPSARETRLPSESLTLNDADWPTTNESMTSLVSGKLNRESTETPAPSSVMETGAAVL